MTPPERWHPRPAVLTDYAAGSSGLAVATSIEAHIVQCAQCRGALAVTIDPARIETVRTSLDDRLDRAERPRLERLLLRLGVGEADCRVLLAAPSMRRSWWLAVLLALGLAVLVIVQDPGGAATPLLLAPLLPVLATATSFAPRWDSALALVAATPYPAIRLLLLRSAAVAAVSTGMAFAVAVALPVPLRDAVAWLLPAVALTTAVVALSTWFPVDVAAAACCAGWLTVVWATTFGQRDSLAVYGATGQTGSAALLAFAAAALVHHRNRLDPGSPA